MKKVDVPFDKSLESRLSKQYRRGRTHNEAFYLATQVGLPLLGMGLTEWMKSRERDRRASANQALIGANPDFGINLPPEVSGDVDPSAIIKGGMEMRANAAQQRFTADRDDARFKAAEHLAQENDRRDSERELARFDAYAEHQERMTGIREQGDFIRESGRGLAAWLKERESTTPMTLPDGRTVRVSNEAAMRHFEPRGEGGGGTALDPKSIPPGSLSNFMKSYPQYGQDEESARFDFANMTPTDRYRHLHRQDKQQALAVANELKARIANARSELEVQRIKAGAVNQLGIYFMKPGNPDDPNSQQTLDTAAYSQFLRDAGLDLEGGAPRVEVPMPPSPTPSPDSFGIDGPPPREAGRQLPDWALQEFQSLPQESRAKALQGLQSNGYDVAPLQSQGQVPAAPASPQTLAAPSQFGGQSPQAPASQPAQQPTSYGAPQAAPQAPVFKPHEMNAFYVAAQQRGIPAQVIDAEIAQNPWGVRQALDQQIIAAMSAGARPPVA